MKLSVAEVARYLPTGGRAPDAAVSGRIAELVESAPIAPRGIFARDSTRMLLCGTIGSAFDAWHRRLAVTSATDALIAQAVGAAAVEREMDELEAAARATLAPGETMAERRSPGYGNRPLAESRDIIMRLDATRRIGVALTASMMLVPSKSVTATCEIAGFSAGDAK